MIHCEWWEAFTLQLKSIKLTSDAKATFGLCKCFVKYINYITRKSSCSEWEAFILQLKLIKLTSDAKAKFWSVQMLCKVYKLHSKKIPHALNGKKNKSQPIQNISIAHFLIDTYRRNLVPSQMTEPSWKICKLNFLGKSKYNFKWYVSAKQITAFLPSGSTLSFLGSQST